MNRVFVAHNPVEGHFVRHLVEREGIDAEVRGEALFGLLGEIPITSDSLPAVWIMQAAQLTRALDVIADYERGKNILGYSCRQETKMSRRLLREGNESDSSVNAVDIPFGNTSQIVEGGCCSPEWDRQISNRPPNLEPAPRRWVVVAALALIVIIALALSRYLSRK